MDSNNFNIEDLNLFEKFFKDKTADFQNYYYIPYLLLSPIYQYNKNKNYDAYMPLIILVKNKKDINDYKFISYHINYSSMDFFPLFTYVNIDANKSLSNLSDLENFKNYFERCTIEISPLNVEEITLKDVMESSLFYKKYNSYATEKDKKEKFYRFQDSKNGKTFILSAIELVRFFYTYGTSDSLRRALLHPMGIELLINNAHLTMEGYNVVLKNECEKVDATPALYFYHQEYIEEMFNSVLTNYKNSEYLYAFFPTYKTFEIYCQCYTLRKDEYLITSIIDTTLFDELKKGHKKVMHPNDKQHDPEKSKSSNSPPKPKPHTTPISPNGNNLDNEHGSSPYLPPMPIVEEKESPFEQVEDKIEYVKNGSKALPKQSAGNNAPHITSYTTQPSAGEDKSGQKIEKQNIFYPSELEEVVPNTKINNLDKNIKYFKNENYSYEIKAYKFPDKKDEKGKVKPTIFSYLDKSKTLRRTYTLVKFHKKGSIFFYLDIEPREDSTKDKNMKKEVLVIKKDIPIDQMQQKYIIKIIFDQVDKGNHKWLSHKRHGLSVSECKLFKHTENMCTNIKNFVENLNSAYKD